MILVIGGTSESSVIAGALAESGRRVLVSLATDVSFALPEHPGIFRRSGRLNPEELEKIISDHEISAIVDAAHPYASEIKRNAKKVAERRSIPYFCWLRPSVVTDDKWVLRARDHDEAAELAFSFGAPVFLTIGSKNLKPYADRSTATGIPVIARVLDHPDSLRACLDSMIPCENILTGRGPFSVEDNIKAIKRFNIGTLVTKDSGDAGGAPAKLEAARLTNCKAIVVDRPMREVSDAFQDLDDLLQAVLSTPFRKFGVT
jgi:precorrin-6A/cobalt-precorrin-6A reductase